MFRLKSKSGMYFAIAGRRADTSAVYSLHTLPDGVMEFGTAEEAEQYRDGPLRSAIGKQFAADEVMQATVEGV